MKLIIIKQLKFSISPAEQLALVIRKDSNKKKRKKETVGMIDIQHEQNQYVSCWVLRKLYVCCLQFQALKFLFQRVREKVPAYVGFT